MILHIFRGNVAPSLHIFRGNIWAVLHIFRGNVVSSLTIPAEWLVIVAPLFLCLQKYAWEHPTELKAEPSLFELC